MTKRAFSLSLAALVLAAVFAAPALAQSPQQFADDATRYMALGDSIAAGYKAMPVTEGYAYRLYLNGVFDRIPHTLFNNASVPGVTSADVLAYQVPQAIKPFTIGGFNPKYITLTVGGNDLLAILAFIEANPGLDPTAFATQVIQAYGGNLANILFTLRTNLPDAKIFVSNQYPLREIEAVVPGATQVIDAFNGTTALVVGSFGNNNVYLVDVHTAFGGRGNLVEGGRGQTSIFEVHPTNVGHRVIEKAFADVIDSVK